VRYPGVLELRMTGYRHLIVTSTVLCFAHFAIAEDLHPEAEHMHSVTEILVTGAITSRDPQDIALPYTLVDEERLRQQSPRSVAEALDDEAGIAASSFVPGASRPLIRGQGGERVRVLANGTGTGDVSGLSDDHAVAADPFALQRVEVIRGPATLLYGGSAIGGVVNMRDQSIPEYRFGKKLTGTLDIQSAEGGDDLRAGGATLKSDADNIQFFVSSFYRRTGNIEIPGIAESDLLLDQEGLSEGDSDHHEGEEEVHDTEELIRNRLPNSDTLAEGLTVGASHVNSEGFFGLSTKLFSTSYGVPGHAHSHAHEHSEEHEHEHEHEYEDEEEHEDNDHETASEEPGVGIDLTQIRVETRGASVKPSEHIKEVRFNAAATTYEHEELEGTVVGTRFENDSVEARFEVAHEALHRFEGGGGFQIQLDEFRVSGKEAYLPGANSVAPALFFAEDRPLTENLTWQFGGRYEMVQRNPQGDYSDRSFHLLGTSQGLLYDFDNGYIVGSHVALAERAPSVAELYADGIHTATQTFEIGDPDLGKERSIGGELFFRKEQGDITATLTSFLQYYTDYISLRPTDREEEGIQVFEHRSSRSLLWGFEADTTSHIFDQGIHNVDFIVKAEYVRGRDEEADVNLPRLPPLTTRLGFHHDAGHWSNELFLVYADSQDKTAPYELPTQSYVTLEAQTSYLLHVREDFDLKLFLRGTNLTDEEVRNHSSFTKDLFPQRGRTVLAALRASF
jgi:iron complex outermembrane recepter protein